MRIEITTCQTWFDFVTIVSTTSFARKVTHSPIVAWRAYEEVPACYPTYVRMQAGKEISVVTISTVDSYLIMGIVMSI